MAVRRSYTAVIERNVVWQGEFATEPYECGWASEAIFFVRALAATAGSRGVARAQVSADGMRWADEGAVMRLPTRADEVTFCKVRHFGGWLRLAGEVADGETLTVIVSLALKE